MLARAVERIDDPEFMQQVPTKVDAELLGALAAMRATRDVALRIKYRRLHKAAFLLPLADASEEQKQAMMDLTKRGTRRAWEDDLARRAGLDDGQVIVDVPVAELLLSEPRIYTTHFQVLDGDELFPLSKFSPLARALQQRTVTQWGLLVACPREAVEVVKGAAERTFVPDTD